MDRKLRIRPLTADDYKAAGRIFFCAVHEGTRSAYSYEQRLAWGGETVDLQRWKTTVKTTHGFIAEDEVEPVGFITIDTRGYVDLMFVLPSAAGKGVGRALLHAAEKWAKANGATRLTTAASIVARPLFEKDGWLALEEEQASRQGVLLTCYKMEKSLL